MNILNYLQENKSFPKAFIYCLVFLLLFSCQSEESSDSDTRHLGFPLNGIVTLRTKPFSLLSKVPDIKNSIKDTTTNNISSEVITNAQLNIVESYLSGFPSLNKLTNDFLLSLEPDLSTYWIMRSGIENDSYFTSLYLKVGNIAHLEQFLIDNSIASEDINPSIKMSLIDDKLEEHLYFVRTNDHLLILMNWGDAETASLFTSKNDIDIKIQSNETVGKLFSHPALKDLSKDLDVNLSLNILPNSLETVITPHSDWDNPIDSILESHSLKEAGLVSLSTQIQLKKLHAFFDKYELSSSINYELKRIGLNLNQLEEQFNGHLYASYLGEKVTQSKSITYEYDDNFNQVEKVVYTSSSSFDFKGLLGLNNRDLTEKYFIKNNFISKIGKNSYQPIVGSNSTISFSDNALTIGKQEDSEIVSQGKLLLQINNLSELPNFKPVNQIVELLEIDRLNLSVSNDNEIKFKLRMNGDPYSYLLKTKDFINPNL